MLPNRSWTVTDKGPSSEDCNLPDNFSNEFLLKCQLFSVRSDTANPLALMCGITLDMWLDPVTRKLRLRGFSSGRFARIRGPFDSDARVNAGGERSIELLGQ